MTWDDVVTIAGRLPEVEVSTSYGTPALKVKGKGFARLRTEAEGGLVLMCRLDDKEALLASGDPAFYTTPHYDGYGAILVDLERVERDQLEELVEEAWRERAPVRVRKAYDAEAGGPGSSGKPHS
ncbi:MmcQ/YjbR family DNA-binding protein [Pseudonocardia sp. DLS-67]